MGFRIFKDFGKHEQKEIKGATMRHYSLVQKNKSVGNLNYSIRIYDTESKVIRFISTKTKNKRLAIEIMTQEQSKQFEKNEKPQSPTLLKAYSLWLDNVTNNFTNMSSASAYRYQTKFIHEYAKQNKDLLLIDFKGAQIVNLFNECSGDISTNQKRQRKVIWGIFFNWAFDTFGINEKAPTKSIKLPKKEFHEKVFFTMEQIETILENTKNHELRFLFAFMAFAGLRFFEAVNMEWEQIANGEIKIKGKGGKFAVLPIGSKLQKEIELYLQTFNGQKVGRIFRNKANTTINNLLKRIVKESGLKFDKPISCHNFRHSFASNLLRKGANIIAVSKLLRHENPSITLNIYSHVLTNDLKETIDIL